MSVKYGERPDRAAVVAPVVIALICGALAGVFWFTGEPTALDAGYTAMAGLGGLVALVVAVRAARARAAFALEDRMDDLALKVCDAVSRGDQLRSNLAAGATAGAVKGSTEKRASAVLSDLDAVVSGWQALGAKPGRVQVGILERRADGVLAGLDKSSARVSAEAAIGAVEG